MANKNSFPFNQLSTVVIIVYNKLADHQKIQKINSKTNKQTKVLTFSSLVVDSG